MEKILWFVVSWRILKAGWPIVLVIAFALWWPASAGHSVLDLLFRTPFIVPLAFFALIAVFAIRAVFRLMKE